MSSEHDATPPAVSQNNRRHGSIAFYLFWAVWMTALGAIWTLHPGLDHGDAFTDAYVLIGGRNYDRIGFDAYAGLPVLETHVTSNRKPDIYSHYPPLPWWIHQGLKTAGVDSLAGQRLLAVIVTALAALIMFRVMCRLSDCRMTGALSAALYMASVPFAAYADSVYQFAYGQLALFATLALWLAAEREENPRRRRARFALAAAAFFVDGWITFEHIPLIVVFILGRTLLCKERRPIAGCAVVAIVVPLLVAITRVAHNAIGLGGLDAAIDDLLTAAERRSGHSETGITYWDLFRVWTARLGGRGLPAIAYDAEFRLPILWAGVWAPGAALAALLVWMRAGKRTHGRTTGVPNALLLLLGGSIWFVVLKQHAIVHRHLVMILLPGVALLLGTLAANGLRQLWTPHSGAFARVVGPIAAVALLTAYVWQLRSSIALNQVARFDPMVRGLVLERRAYYDCIGRARPALADLELLSIYGRYPQVAWELDVPFNLVEDVPDALGPNQALWIAAISPPERDAAGEAFARFGLPDVLNRPAGGRYVFRNRPGEAAACDLRFESGWRLVNIRAGETLDGRAWTLQLIWAHDQFAAAAKDVFAFCHVVDALNTAKLKLHEPVRSAIGGDQQRFETFTLPKSEVSAGSQLVFGLLSGAAQRPLRIVEVAQSLPAGARAVPGGDYVSWTPPAMTGR